jgi:WD40 repeat protein
MKRIFGFTFAFFLFAACLQAQEVPAVELKMKGRAEITENTYAHFSPDGKKIVATKAVIFYYYTDEVGKENDTLSYCTRTRYTRIFDVESGKELHKFDGDVDVSVLPDGKRIVISDAPYIRNDGPNIRIVDAESGKELQEFEQGYYKGYGLSELMYPLFLSVDGKKIVIKSKGETRIVDTESGKELHKLDEDQFYRFFPDGKKIVTVGEKGTRIWDIALGKVLHEFEGDFDDLSPDGKKILTSREEKEGFRVVDADSGKELQKIDIAATYRTQTASFSPDGKKILTTEFDSQNRIIRIWDVDSGKELQNFDDADIYFSPDGKKMITTHRGAPYWRNAKSLVTVRIWDAESGKELRKLEDQIDACFVSFSPDGKKFVTANGYLNYGGYGNVDDAFAIRIWDADTGKEMQWLKERAGTIYCADFFPDGKKLVTVSKEDNAIRIWNLE